MTAAAEVIQETCSVTEDARAQRLISDYEAKITAVSVDADDQGNMLIACN